MNKTEGTVLNLTGVFPVLQEVEHGGRVKEEDMATLIQQLEGRVGSEVQVVISPVS